MDGTAEVGIDRQAVDLGHGGIEPEIAQLMIEEAKAHGSVVEQAVQKRAFTFELVQEPQAFLDGFLEFGDVADDAGEDSAHAEAGLADGQLHRE